MFEEFPYIVSLLTVILRRQDASREEPRGDVGVAYVILSVCPLFDVHNITKLIDLIGTL